jgi:hydroxymethylbilane synthase
LKDLPTELPSGLKLGGVAGKRQNVRDVLIYRDADYLKAQGDATRRGFKSRSTLKKLPRSLTVATSSTRRAAQLLEMRPDFKVVQIRGNVATRLEKLAHQPDLDATILAAAGLARLKFHITPAGRITGDGVPEGLLATIIDTKDMLPCVGQAAIGIEIRENDERLDKICRRLNHAETWHSIVAERALLRAMGGGCQTPIGAHAEVRDNKIHLQAVSFMGKEVKRAKASGPIAIAVELGEKVASKLK